MNTAPSSHAATSRAPRRHPFGGIVLTCFVAAAGLSLLACNRDAPAGGPGVLTGATLQAAKTPTLDGSVQVTLFESDGTTPAEGYSVAAINSATGIAYTGVTDANGVADITANEPGQYCVDALPVSSGLPITTGSPIPPPGGGPTLSGFPTTDAATLSGPGGTSVSLNYSNFKTNCIDSPPLSVKNKNGIDVSLTLQPGNMQTVDVNDLSGDAVTSTNGYVGIPLQWSDLPSTWKPANVPSNINPLLLLAASPYSPDVSSVEVPIDPNYGGGTLVFETDYIGANLGDLSLTGTLFFTATGGTYSVSTEPLICSTGTVDESSTDANGSLNFLPVVKSGFLGYFNSDNLLLPQTGAVAMWWHQQGSGSVTLSVRDRTTDWTKTFNETLSCDGDTNSCTVSKAGWGSLVGSGGFQFDHFVGPDGTSTRVTYVLSGLPSDSVEWSVSTSGDQIPDPSKNLQSSAYVYIVPPSSCVVQNNDNGWLTF